MVCWKYIAPQYINIIYAIKIFWDTALNLFIKIYLSFSNPNSTICIFGKEKCKILRYRHLQDFLQNAKLVTLSWPANFRLNLKYMMGPNSCYIIIGRIFINQRHCLFLWLSCLRMKPKKMRQYWGNLPKMIP